MKQRFNGSAPSAGFWLVLSSWTAAAAFLGWAGREPRLDWMKRELDRIATSEQATASNELVTELRRELVIHPELSAALSGPTGARAIEAHQDGRTRSAHFHVALAPSAGALELVSDGPVRVELASGSERLTIDLAGSRPERVALPSGWRGRAQLIDVKRSGTDVEVGIRGLEEPTR